MCAGNKSKTGCGLVMVTLGKNGGENRGKKQCRERRDAVAFLTGETCKERGGKGKERGAGRGKGKEGETEREGEEKRGRAALRNEEPVGGVSKLLSEQYYTHSNVMLQRQACDRVWRG